VTRIFRLEEPRRRATFTPVRTGAAWVVCLAAAIAGCGAEDRKDAPEGSAKSTAAPPGETAKASAHANATARQPMPSSRDGGFTGGVEVPPSATAEIGAPIGGDKQRRFVFQAFTSDDVAGRLKQEDVAKAFADNERTFGACLSVDAVAKIKLKVSPSGRVSEARVRELVPNDPRVRDCIARELGKLTFPKLSGTEPATVEIDLALRKT